MTPESVPTRATDRYEVGCPKCHHINISQWTDELPPGGVEPVECLNCGYMILSESEGDPMRKVPKRIRFDDAAEEAKREHEERVEQELRNAGIIP